MGSGLLTLGYIQMLSEHGGYEDGGKYIKGKGTGTFILNLYDQFKLKRPWIDKQADNIRTMGKEAGNLLSQGEDWLKEKVKRYNESRDNAKETNDGKDTKE